MITRLDSELMKLVIIHRCTMVYLKGQVLSGSSESRSSDLPWRSLFVVFSKMTLPGPLVLLLVCVENTQAVYSWEVQD